MSPAYEILNLWVSRMIMMSGFHLGKVPFRTVMIHGLVRAKNGQKFSKSLNNGIDPIDMISKYGADALRMGLLTGTAIGNDINFDENKIKGYKNFANKLWNITRFILSSTEGHRFDPDFSTWTETDKTLTAERDALIVEVTKEMEEYKLYLVAEKLYHYVWHTLADKILEESKQILGTTGISEGKGTDTEKKSRAQFLLHTLNTVLKALHPFIPFVTEEIWLTLPHNTDQKLLMVEKWPSEV
jgi:valyl-tRNA synthetase